MWAKQPQILRYMEHVVGKYGLETHLQLKTMMTDSHWDELENRWTIKLTSPNGTEFEKSVDYLILAVGALHIPQFPSISGVSKVDGSSPFLGPSFHSAKWDHSAEIKGKRVGVIGSGASAIQLIPEIAKEVKELFVFQRTPPHVFPKTDFEFPNFMKTLYRTFPFLMTLTRWAIFFFTELRFGGLYEGSLFHHWMRIDALRYLKSVVKSPELRKKLIPNYTIGCKRMLFSSFWYPALVKENVHVINNRILNVNPTGIAVQSDCATGAAEGREVPENIPLDVIVYATGFQLTRENAPQEYQFDVIGRGGVSLNHWHQTNPRTLLGMAAPGFPNLFQLYGPNTNLGHNSIVFMIECQADYVTNLVTQSLKKGYTSLEVREESVKKFHEEVIKKGLKGKVTSPPTPCSSR
jgi:cation diffusion facilitator CzcD-associated flavoprotein CzcO